MENKSFETAKVFRFNKEVDYSENGIVSKRVIEKKTGNVSLFAFDKGQSLSEHTAPFDAMVQVVEGTAQIIINKQAQTLNIGETIIMPANIPHAVYAIEKFKMVLTMIKEVI
ncbi:MAG: cupin domain-containing protein [Bacteroidales bacterium]